eukprot:TRINITY_DN4156_c0_g1_i1.p1 TRINITY_DN4156_c0_g1~~TRINITY_DN4156_c0_g1_i1.p1  ORF type:complete len:604 (-),score=243.07 TRINITY_DN4156_c0_g1_i1:58-1869(-)
MPATSAWQASGPSADSKRDPDASSPVASPARPRAVRQSVHETHSPARDDQPAPAARTASSAFGYTLPTVGALSVADETHAYDADGDYAPRPGRYWDTLAAPRLGGGALNGGTEDDGVELVSESSGDYGSSSGSYPGGVAAALAAPGARGANWWETAGQQPWHAAEPPAAAGHGGGAVELDLGKLTQSLEALAASSSSSSNWLGGSDSDSGSDTGGPTHLLPMHDGKAAAAERTGSGTHTQHTRRRPERENLSWIELVRALASCLLFLAHTVSRLVSVRPAASVSASVELPFVVLCHTLASLAAPLFVLTSGYLLLPRLQSTMAGDFYRRRLPRLLAPALAWAMLYYVWQAALDAQPLSARGLLRSVATDFSGSRLWFVRLMLCLYGMTPLLARAVQRFEAESLVYAVLLWLAADPLFAAFVVRPSLLASAFDALRGSWLPVYVLAGVLVRYRGHQLLGSRRLLSACVVCVVLATPLLALGTYRHALHAAHWQPSVVPPPGVLVSAVSVCVLVVVRRLGQLPCYSRNARVLEVVRTFASSCWGMYLVLPLVLDAIDRWPRTVLIYTQLSPLATVPVLASAAGFVSYTAAALLRRLPLVGFIVGR